MDMKLNHSDLSALFANVAGLSVSEAETFTKTVFELIIDGLENDGIVKINGLGTFKVVNVEKRLSVNVNTGERFEIKEHKKLSFIPAESLKNTINAPFSMFQPVEIDEDLDDDGGPFNESLSDDDEEVFSDKMCAAESISDSLKKEKKENNVIQNEQAESSVTVSSALSLDCIEEEIPAGDDVRVNLTTAVDIEEEVPVVASNDLNRSIVNVNNIKITEEKSPIVVDNMENTHFLEKQIQDKYSLTDEFKKEGEYKNEAVNPVTLDEVVTEKSVIEKGAEKLKDTAVNEDDKVKNSNKLKSFFLLLVLLLILCLGGYFLRENNWKIIEDVPEYVSEIQNVNTVVIDTIKDNDNSVLSVLNDSTESLMKDTVAIIENLDSFVAERQAERLKTEEKSLSEREEFELVDAVAKRELSTIFVADTMDYKIIGTLCEHIVRSEETLIRISLKYYGDKRLWPYIVKYNNMVRPNDLACDMMLRIPRLAPNN